MENVLATMAEQLGPALVIVGAALAAGFAGGRHQPRVEKLGAPAFLREPA